MKKESLIKAILMIGGGYLVFLLFKPKKDSALPTSSAKTNSFEGAPDTKNADIVATAYSEALKAGESPSRLTELNKEMMKEFNMRCYVNESSQVVVCDVKGNTILTK
jgi:hypothetical protein